MFGSIFGSMAAIEMRRRSFAAVPQNEQNAINLERGREKLANKRKKATAITYADFCKYSFIMLEIQFFFVCFIILINFFCLGTPHARKALKISIMMITLGYTSGILTILAFITQIFQETGSILTEKQSAIVISFTQIMGNIVLLNIVERFNRRVSRP